MLNNQRSLDLLFQALADPTRRAIVDRLTRGPASVSDLAKPLPMSLPAVVQHLQVLEQSGLVTTAKLGRVRTCTLDTAALSLAEGLEETLTLHRLNGFPAVGVSFKTRNLIESVMSRLEARTRRVTRWRTSDQKLRWCAAALGAMERQFRRVKP